LLREFEAEEAFHRPYRGERMSALGRSDFSILMRRAIEIGSEVTLTDRVIRQDYWMSSEGYTRAGVTRERCINFVQAAEQLGLSEFNTWYVRGLSRRLLDEGVEHCQICRGTMPKWEPGESSAHEGLVVRVQDVYDGHRIRYWPKPGRPDRLSIPFTPGCHHTIRRVAKTRFAV